MSISLTIDFNNLKSLITQCALEEKIEIISLLEKETFQARFDKFLSAVKTDALALDEITTEVEVVRQRRYHERR